jgi:hypothetical protein
MKNQTIQEPARVLFHLNGYTKVLLERTDGAGLADGGIVWDIDTENIPAHLRRIGSRFIVRYTANGAERDQIEFLELSEI